MESKLQKKTRRDLEVNKGTAPEFEFSSSWMPEYSSTKVEKFGPNWAPPIPVQTLPPGVSGYTTVGNEELAKLLKMNEPMTWESFFDTKDMVNDTVPVYTAGSKGHVFVCLHGAGHSAMSFAVLAEIMKVKSTVVAFDFRGHGQHYCEDETCEDETDMS